MYFKINPKAPYNQMVVPFVFSVTIENKKSLHETTKKLVQIEL